MHLQQNASREQGVVLLKEIGKHDLRKEQMPLSSAQILWMRSMYTEDRCRAQGRI